MDVNGVTSGVSGYSAYSSQAKTVSESTTDVNQTTTQINEASAVYEPSDASTTTDTVKKTYTQNTELIAKLKADADERTAQLKSIVEKLISGQGNALGMADDMWSFLRTGDFTVDAETKAQAQADIADDGYWGVEQTSDRIIDFATALTGGDPDKLEEMREAFKEGYEQATKTWGDELPEISKKTYEAVMQKFDDLAAQYASESEA